MVSALLRFLCLDNVTWSFKSWRLDSWRGGTWERDAVLEGPAHFGHLGRMEGSRRTKSVFVKGDCDVRL